MLQTLLVAAFITGATVFLTIRAYAKFFSKKDNCDGCAVHKMQEQK